MGILCHFPFIFKPPTAHDLVLSGLVIAALLAFPEASATLDIQLVGGTGGQVKAMPGNMGWVPYCTIQTPLSALVRVSKVSKTVNW